LGLYQFPCPSQ